MFEAEPRFGKMAKEYTNIKEKQLRKDVDE